jgi:hypothetical protein
VTKRDNISSKTVTKHVAIKPLIRPDRFDEWLGVYFAPYDNVDSPWARYPPGCNDQPEFRGTDDEIVELFTYTMLLSGTELTRFSDSQVGVGLDNLLNNHFADVAHTVRDGATTNDKKVAALRSLKVLYSDCLSPRAAPVLGHRDEQAACKPLNRICYMLWDVTPLAYWPDADRGAAVYPVIVEVMEQALQSPNCAVVESGLHGLGHTVYKCEDLAVAAIDRFLETRCGQVQQELIEYALQARTGMIQ